MCWRSAALPQYFARLQQERGERAKRKFERMGDRTGYYAYGPLRRKAPHTLDTPAQWALKVLLQGFVSAIILFLLISTVIGVVVIVRWVMSLI